MEALPAPTLALFPSVMLISFLLLLLLVLFSSVTASHKMELLPMFLPLLPLLLGGKGALLSWLDFCGVAATAEAWRRGN